MQPTRQTQAEDYRQRAARVRRGAEHAPPGELHNILLRLAAAYDEIADSGDNVSDPEDDDATIVFPHVGRRLRSGIAVLYYRN
jgi:hypothetical protein